MPGSNSLAVHVTADTKQLNAGLAAAEARVQAFGATVNEAAASEAARAGDRSLIAQAQTTAQAWVASRQAMIAAEERANAVLKAGRKANAASVAATLDELDARHDAFLAASRRYYESLTTMQQEAYAAQETAANKSIEAEYQRLAARLDDAAAVDTDTAALGANTAALTFNAQAQREASYAISEALTGRYGRLETTMFSLGARTGLMAKLMSPLGLAIGGAAAGVALFTGALIGGERESAAFNRAILATDNAVGITEGQFNAMAEAITGGDTTIGTARDALLAFAQSGQFTGATLSEAARAAIDFANLTGKSLKEAETAVEELATKPAEAIAKLDEQYHFLTAAQYEHIAQLEREGRMTQAAQAAVEAFGRAMHERAIESQKDEGIILKGWDAIKQAVSGTWEALKGIGRDNTLVQQIAGIKAQLVELKARDPFDVTGSQKALENQLALLQAKERAAEATAKQKAHEDQIRADGVRAQQYLDKQIAGTKTHNALLEHEKELTSQIEALHRADAGNPLLKGDIFSSSGSLVKGNASYEAIVARLQKQFDAHPIQLSFSSSAAAAGNDKLAISEQEIRDADQTLNAINRATQAAAQERLSIEERVANEKQSISEREIRDADQTLMAINGVEQRAARQREQTWRASLRTVEGAENQFLSGYLSGRLNLAAAERQLVQRMAITEIQAAAHAVTEKLMLQAAGVAKGKSISILAGQEEIMRDAAQAAAGAYKATVGIPYVGPIIAPIAAATAFTAVEAFKNVAGFDQGTSYVPRTGLAMIHESEMILPPPQAAHVRSMMQGGGGDGGAVHHHGDIVVADTDLRSMLRSRSNRDALVGAIGQAIRDGARV